MITLYTFGPAWGLPDPSPFVMKAQVLLKMSGLPFQENTKGFNKAPKGKQPYIEDEREVIADSTFIRLHIEKKYKIDFDKGLTAEERGVAWAVEKMCEEHLYWAIIDARWMDDDNFAKGPAQFFNFAPAPIRPIVKAIVRRKVAKNMVAQGMGRHSREEIALLAARDLDAIAGVLGNRTYLMGPQPCGADATVFAFVAGVLCPRFHTPIINAARAHANLVAYSDRMLHAYFAEAAKAA